MTEEYDKLEEEARTVTEILIEENTKYNDMLKLPYVEVKDVVEKSMKDIKSLEKKLKRLNCDAGSCLLQTCAFVTDGGVIGLNSGTRGSGFITGFVVTGNK